MINSEFLDENHEAKWEEYAPNGEFEGKATNTTLKEGGDTQYKLPDSVDNLVDNEYLEEV